MDRVAPLLAAIGAFLRWWRFELVGLLPGPLRRRLGAGPVLLADPENESFRFRRLREATLAPFAGDPRAAGLPVWLRLPASAVLTRTLEWPAMAPADLRRAALLDLDRQTPERAEALHFDVVVLARDAAARRLTIELAVARAEVVTAIRTRLLTRHGITPARVGAAVAGDDAVIRFDLRPAEPQATPASHRPGLLPRRTRGRLALACAVLLAVNLGLYWQSESARRESLDTAVAEARRRGNAVEALRTSLAERRRLRDEIISRGGGPTLLAVLDELTRLVPDEAWLDSVEVRGGSVYVTGFAPVAVTLVALIEGSPMFADAQFRSPVVPDGGTGLERFDMTIGLRGRS